MKTTVAFLLLALLLSGCEERHLITKDTSQLPRNAQNFLVTYFPNEELSYIIIEKEGFSTSYEVRFVSGTELTFDRDGNWVEVNCLMSEVPEGIAPTAITDYVQQHFATEYITKIEIDDYRYEVRLSNRLELVFSLLGNFIRIDD